MKIDTELAKLLVLLAFALILGLIALSFMADVQASGNHNITINNYYDSPPPPDVPAPQTLTITNGVSDAELAEGIATAMAAGGHQFDYSTTDWQGSIVGAFQLSEEEENTASFAVGKRFKKMDALLHVTYTPQGSDDWLMVGGTFRF